MIFKDFRNCETSKNIEKPMVFIGFCYCQHFEKTLTIHQKIRPKIVKHQRKSLPESLSKQCSQKDDSNLAKNVPWNPPGLQNGSPDRCQETPDGSQHPSKITLLGIWDPPAAANRSQGCSGEGKPSKLDPKIIQNSSKNH